MFLTLTHHVGLFPGGASATRRALILKTEQIKVTAGKAQEAKDDTQECAGVCADVVFFFFLL